eukprot:TRINITY_DN30770_c0_g1_i1.p1 TRINITY_DN30770_c0_g1~~TRINITY_DN30770_c0_g1_i1.p1  ORF type:complete len:369 (+),score=42.60 TRINITY_DN30770_c0_g1_i1:43-1149(+)
MTEIKVTTSKSAKFYARACQNFLEGTKASDGKDAKSGVESVVVSGLGSAIPVATQTVALLLRARVALVRKVETELLKLSGGSVACLKITLRHAPFPLLDIMSDRGLRAMHSLPPVPGLPDVFVCSYPKSGTTWMQHIVSTLCAGGVKPGEHVSDYTPFYDIDPHWDLDVPQLSESIQAKHRKNGRRMFNTHLRWEMMPSHLDARFIYVVRDGRDTCVSFYHHLSHQMKKDGSEPVETRDFAAFHADWVKGQMPFGSWADHLWSWNAAKGDERVLFVRYEDLLTDLKPNISRIASHLGVDLTEAQLDNVLPKFSFNYMKENRALFEPVSVQWKDNFAFIRKGEASGGSELYTPQLLAEFQSMASDLPSW